MSVSSIPNTLEAKPADGCQLAWNRTAGGATAAIEQRVGEVATVKNQMSKHSDARQRIRVLVADCGFCVFFRNLMQRIHDSQRLALQSGGQMKYNDGTQSSIS
jgi:hypothetical protein